jgi:glyoxylase I family protein
VAVEGGFEMGLEFVGSCPLFQVFDMPASLAFYCDVLGFEIDSHSGEASRLPDVGWVLLRRGRTEVMLNTAYEREHRPAEADPARIAAHGDTALYFACEDLDGAYAYLRGKGVAAREPQAAWYGMKQMYLKDPDGYELCFQWPATQARYDEWVAAYGLEARVILGAGLSRLPDCGCR